jgi:hypothetical protein
MNTTSEIPPTEKRPNIAAGIAARFGAVAISFALQAAILFLGAGRLDWVWAWVYLGISFVSLLINGTIMLRTNPETIAERGRPEGTKGWDKVVGGLWGLVQFVGIPLVAALDVRFGWTQEFGVAWHWAGAVTLAAGLGLSGWAMIANAYF